ncbi:hypothetical protein RZA67_10130 [Stenotrophomonas sp. C3(2023)]|uniref:hypothetical protein n=1 Tax=Stenotrophomonas sp. C3(2023) TaxID=3080277 RepID=UPI00293C1BAC|nr:hypothetical protein [Stenotrophomonas sp. C3(2023)]MDV3469084.1 hypothetical protein [Stenotrophomonas sp. C3(2023)]
MKVLLAGLLCMVSASAVAAQGEVCLTVALTTPVQQMRSFDDSAVFNCSKAGSATVSQLYDKGWRVVAVFPQSSMDVARPGTVSVVWTAVIEKL